MNLPSFFKNKTSALILAAGLGLVFWGVTAFAGAKLPNALRDFFAKSGENTELGTDPHPQPPVTIMNFDYEKAWREIDSLEQRGLPKSALEKTEALLDAARKEGQPAQMVKALVFRGKYQSQLEEYGLPMAIHRFEEELAKADYPVKPILQSMLAELYTNYLEQNRWTFQNRTQTVDFKPEDIKTWSLEQLTQEAAKLYKASLADTRLKGTALDDFKLLLNEGRNDEGLRPSLYDFLAHRAIDYFMNERSYLTQPAYKFYIDDARAFATAADFVNWKPTTQDTGSQKYQTLLLFQDLLRLHLLEKTQHSPALLDTDLKRLQFMYDNAVLDTKDDAYMAALQDLNKAHEGYPLQAEVLFQLASYYVSNGADYQAPPPGAEVADDKKWYYKKAVDLCNKAMDSYPKSYGGIQCSALKASVYARSLNISVEQTILPNEPALARVDYKNVPQVWFKILRLNEKRRTELEKLQTERDANERSYAYLNKLRPVKTWTATLPDDRDFREHAAEVKIDPLPIGAYILLTGTDAQFTQTEQAVGYQVFHVSNIGYWERQGDNEQGLSFFTFHRQTGAPLKGVKAEFWEQHYNAVFRNYSWKKTDSQTSDANGFVQRPNGKAQEQRNYKLLLRMGKDTLFTGNSHYDYLYPRQNNEYDQTQFFLDRGIYRPGQTVYFKGIALHFDGKRMPAIAKNQPVTVTFKDANYQPVSSLELRTNEYGTFSGQFTAPRSGLTGQMMLESSHGGQAQTFQVEDYKRPKFEVSFEAAKGSYRLNDTIKVEGKAVAYAGSNIDGAQVAWRVVRQVRFPWLPWWYRGWFPMQGETMEIANGLATTDAEGKFAIDFKALPDRSIAKDKKPEFAYTVYADVTDITGETQSTETSVSVGYISMKAAVTANTGPFGTTGVNLDSLRQFNLVTENLNGQFLPAQGRLKLELLRSPKQVFLDRPWPLADEKTMTEGEFRKHFPRYAWANENEPATWAVDRAVLDTDFDTQAAKSVLIGKVKLVPGWYALTMTTQDKYGEKVEVKAYFKGYDLGEKALPQLAPFWQVDSKANQAVQPGETVPLYFFTSEKQAYVLLEIEKDATIIQRKWLTLKDRAVENFVVDESHRGNVHYHYASAMYNRSETAQGTIQVPWSNKDLTIEYGSFRDKLQPGQAEEWVVKIKGPKGEKLAAEMVAGMYDASLDVFAPNSWGMNIWPSSWTSIRYASGAASNVPSNWLYYPTQPGGSNEYRQYRSLNWFNWYMYENIGHNYRYSLRNKMEDREMMMSAQAPAPAMAEMSDEVNIKGSRSGAANYYIDGVRVDGARKTKDEDNGGGKKPEPPATDLSQVKVRTNLQETVFFYPHLMTDAEGNVVIKFTMNEALTRWKFLGLATTTDLQVGATQKEVVTQKDLMVMPNPPRFFREFDEIEFTAKVSNLTDKPLSGEAKLELVNALTGEKLNWTAIATAPQTTSFTAAAKQSARLAWRFRVPDIAKVPVIEHTVIATAGAFSDAERSAAPVLSNRMLVTETMPLPVRGMESKKFVLKSLQASNSATLRHQGLTLEFTQNPAWYAVQALPYLMEYPYDCTEQVFSRYYANSLATSVANAHPKIKSVFERWQKYEPEALKSNLSKNQELKTALLEETPWVLQAQAEEQQKQNIALLFDLNRMAYEQEVAMKKLLDRQMPGGGWAWFPGGPDSRYITQYIVEGLGHLQKLGVKDLSQNSATRQMVETAVRYCDDRMVDQYEDLADLVKKGKAKWEDDHLDYMAAHYLYARSFFLQDRSAQASTGKGALGGAEEIPLNGKAAQVHAYYAGQAEKYWLNKGNYTEGMLALALDRTGRATAAKGIVQSLKERSLNNPELGMYWKYPTGWWWYQAPIETHALMIEVFADVANDPVAVDDLKGWLPQNKQTTNWKTTKATAAAVYALLSNGDNWLLDNQPLAISLGDQKSAKAADRKSAIGRAQSTAEAGTGYFKLRFDGSEVSADMANITVSNPNKVVAWGAAYWQYFEQLDKIKTFEETPLTIRKQLFRVENSATGEVLRPIAEGQKLKVGEKLKVRIELRVDRDMEYVHMKDMRASGFEPINTLSQYKWQGRLGYYESTRDAATNFFFSWLPKGTHVFEYPLRVTYNGDFSNGITTVQCMYAPEFTSHSAGIRVKVGE